MKRVTIKDIARSLSLSTSTVSRALVGDKNIREETKALILEAARKLGYRPNPVAKNLKAGYSNTIGVIVPELVTPFASQVMEGIKSVCYPAGTKVIVADSDEDWRKELDNLRLMEEFMVDGIIISICDCKRNIEEIERLRAARMPMVFYDRIVRGVDVTQVVVDDRNKSYFLIERLIRSGRRHIVHIMGPGNISNSEERLAGYREAMSKFGLMIDEDMVIRSGVKYADGERAAEHST